MYDVMSRACVGGKEIRRCEPSRLAVTGAQAAAYVASRMPGCYAAVLTVLQELRMRLPAFQPASLLDFGAGPGTAIWAAQQVSRCAPEYTYRTAPPLQQSAAV